MIAAVTVGVVVGCVASQRAGLFSHRHEAPAEAEVTERRPAVSAEAVASDRGVCEDLARRSAMDALAEHYHEITDVRVTFYRDIRREGTALQQFVEVFGAAVAEAVFEAAGGLGDGAEGVQRQDGVDQR